MGVLTLPLHRLCTVICIHCMKVSKYEVQKMHISGSLIQNVSIVTVTMIYRQKNPIAKQQKPAVATWKRTEYPTERPLEERGELYGYCQMHISEAR